MLKEGKVYCDYCGQPAQLVTGKTIYGRDFARNWFWRCVPCGAWVGCHANSEKKRPMGRLANKELRALKRRGHDLFDPIWQAAWKHRGGAKNKIRDVAYRWLAENTGIERRHCHFGEMDDTELATAIRFLELYYANLRSKGILNGDTESNSRSR